MASDCIKRIHLARYFLYDKLGIKRLDEIWASAEHIDSYIGLILSHNPLPYNIQFDVIKFVIHAIEASDKLLEENVK